MSVLSDVENTLSIVETDVVKFFATVKADIKVVEQDFINILQWMCAHGSEIATDVAGLIGVVAAAGVGIPAPVLAAAQGLNVAVAAVNAAVAAQQASQAAGGTVSQQAITEAATAYQALKNVQITTSQAQASVASGTTPSTGG
jgi:hypothetical protein